MEIAGGVTVLSILAHRSSHYSFTPWLFGPPPRLALEQGSIQPSPPVNTNAAQAQASVSPHSPYWHSTAGQKRNVIQHSRASINKPRGKTAQDSSLGIHHMQTLDRPNRVSGGTGKQLLYSAIRQLIRQIFITNR